MTTLTLDELHAQYPDCDLLNREPATFEEALNEERIREAATPLTCNCAWHAD